MPQDESNGVPAQEVTQVDAGPAAPADPAVSLTQADIDRVVKERVARERAKFADYDRLKAAADRLQRLEDADKTAQQKAAEEVAQARAEAEAAKADVVRFRAAASHGVTGEDIDLIGVGPEDAVTARAERIGRLLAAERELAKLKEAQGDAAKQPPQARPVPREWQPGATPVSGAPGPSAKDRAIAQARALWGVGQETK